MSLRARLSFSVVAIVLTTTLGLATAALFYVKRNVQASIAAEQFARMSSIADVVDQKFIGRRSMLRLFGKSVETQAFPDAQPLQAFLVEHRDALRENFDNVAFIDTKGEIVANLNGAQQIGRANLADRDYFKETIASRSGVISQPYRNRINGLAQVAITQPVFDDEGAVRWMIAGSLNLTEENFLGELARIKFGKTGYMFITNTNGIVVDHPRKSRILKHSDAEGGSNPATTRAIAGFQGTTEGMNRVGVYGLYAFKQIRQTNWVLGSIYPRDEAFQELRSIEQLAWLGAILLTIVAGGLTVAILHSQLSPLHRLHGHMEIARSNSGHASLAMPGAPREIVEMARTFDALMVEREAAQSALRQSEDHLRSVLTHAPDAFVSIDTDGRVTDWNRQAEATFGWWRSDVVGKKLSELLIPTHQRAAHEAGLAHFVLTGEGPVVNTRIEVAALHRDGREIPVELSVAAVRQGDVFVANAFLRDITERRHAQAQLAASEKRARDIADNVPALIGYFDPSLRMEFANARARRMLRIDPTRSHDLKSVLGEKAFAQNEPYLATVLGGKSVRFEAEALIGPVSHFQTHMVPDIDEAGTVKGFYTMTFDVSDLKQAERRLIELARVDTLTQLPNRRRFLEKLDEALARSKREGRPLALIYLDIDYFKQINDSFGHAMGDAVLVGFAKRLLAAVRGTDTVARLAGDEFVVILEGLRAVNEAPLVAAKIVASMQLPLDIPNQHLTVTSSMGVAVIEGIEPDQETEFALLEKLSADELIARADRALYAAKRAGRNRYAVFDESGDA